MAIAFGSVGAGASAAGVLAGINGPYPASISAGDLLLLWFTWKYPVDTITTPSGWTAPANGTQTAGSGTGIDVGATSVAVFVKVADGTETGSLNVNLTDGGGAGTSVITGAMHRYTKASGMDWHVACAGGASGAGTAHSVTAGSNPGIEANDFIVAASCCNTDTPTRTAEAIAATGATFGAMVERWDGGNGGGDDQGFWVTEHPVTAGPATAPPVYTSTHSAGTPTGATVLVRLREIVAVSAAVAITFGAMTMSSSAEVVGGIEGPPPVFTLPEASFTAPSPPELSAAEALLGRDLRFEGDLSVHAGGDWSVVDGIAAVRQSILNEAMTSPGEHVFRPEYGMGLADAVKRPQTRSVIDELKNRVRDRLAANPRVTAVKEVELVATTVTTQDGRTQPAWRLTLRVEAGGRDVRIDPLTIGAR